MSISTATVSKQKNDRFSKIHDLLNKTLVKKMNQMNSSSGGLPKSLYSSSSSTSASTMMVKTNSNSTCRISSPRSPSPPSFLLKGIQDKIKRNEFSKLEQLLAAKLQSKIPNKPKQSKPASNNQSSSDNEDDFSLSTISIDEIDYDSKQPMFEHGDKIQSSSSSSNDDKNRPKKKFTRNEIVKILEEKHYLENKCHEIYLVQRQISNLLKEFYQKCLDKQKRMGKYYDNLVYAHKCLLISSEQQNLIKRQIQMLNLSAKNNFIINNNNNYANKIQNHHCNNELLKNFWPNHHLIDEKSKKCLAIKSLSIKLHEKRLRQIFLRDQTGCFLVCLLEHENRLIEKPIIFINEWDIDDQLNDTITIDINEIFNIDDDDDDNDDNDDNKQDFIVTIKIFFMFHPIDNRQQQRKRRQEINWKKFIPIRGLMTKIVSSLKKRKRLDVKQIDLTSVARCLNQQQPINSSFQLLGQIKLDYSNLGQQQRPFRLEKFNYCCIFDNEIHLDFELSSDNDDNNNVEIF